jgi:ferredoxin
MQQDTVCFNALLLPAESGFDAPPDLPLLVAAEHAGLLMANSCRNGTCRTCICHLASGGVQYRIAWPGLSAEEKRDGYILPCVAYPTSDVTLVLPERAGYIS